MHLDQSDQWDLQDLKVLLEILEDPEQLEPLGTQVELASQDHQDFPVLQEELGAQDL